LIFGCHVILGKRNNTSRLEGVVLDLYKITSQMGDPRIASSCEGFSSSSEGYASSSEVFDSSNEVFASSNEVFASSVQECRIHVIF
jgi:hypothetical protein